jgi:hypothetical protein
MPEACEPKCADEVDSLIREVLCFVRSRRASGEVSKKRRVLMELVITEVSHGQRVRLPIVEEQTASRRLHRIRLAVKRRGGLFDTTSPKNKIPVLARYALLPSKERPIRF